MTETDAEFAKKVKWWIYCGPGSLEDKHRLYDLICRGAEVQGNIVLPVGDYRRLLEAAECDDRLIWCQTCGAWIEHDDPACASTDDYTGCWKVAAGEDAKPDNCRSYRAVTLPPPPAGEPR